MQRRLAKLDRNDGLVATVSARALMRLAPSFAESANDGMRPQCTCSTVRPSSARCRTTVNGCVGATL